MDIAGKPGERVFQAKDGGDTFLVLNFPERMLYLYQTVETLMCPSTQAFVEYQDRPYFWSEATGMMSILSEVSFASWADIRGETDAASILESMEVYLQHL